MRKCHHSIFRTGHKWSWFIQNSCLNVTLKSASFGKMRKMEADRWASSQAITNNQSWGSRILHSIALQREPLLILNPTQTRARTKLSQSHVDVENVVIKSISLYDCFSILLWFYSPYCAMKFPLTRWLRSDPAAHPSIESPIERLREDVFDGTAFAVTNHSNIVLTKLKWGRSLYRYFFLSVRWDPARWANYFPRDPVRDLRFVAPWRQKRSERYGEGRARTD